MRRRMLSVVTAIRFSLRQGSDLPMDILAAAKRFVKPLHSPTRI
jgi:hypothetical protein